MGSRSSSIHQLKNMESRAWISTLAMMCYNPSIARVLSRGGVDCFAEIAWKKVHQVNKVNSQRKFDRYHQRFINDVKKKIRSPKGKTISYRHAQKPINVFLKMYAPLKAKHVERFLHVRIDRTVMKAIKRQFGKYYDRHVRPIYIKQKTKNFVHLI